MARQRLRFLAGIPRTQPRQTFRRPTPGRRGADGRGLRRELQEPAGRRLSARVPHKIASYARSRDYHPVLKEMLGTMLEALRRQYPGLTGRTFVDTAPLLENNWPSKRVWAGSGGNPCCLRPNTAPMSCWASWYLPCRPTNTMPRSQEPVAAAAGTAWTVVQREPSSRPR